MAVSATWELVGANELLASISELKGLVGSKEGRSAARAAAVVIQKALKANAEKIDDPETPNSIPLNIAIGFNSRLFKRTGDIGFRIGVNGGAKYRKFNPGKKGPGGDTWYWRLVEFGTKNFAAKPFVRPALAMHTQEATEAFLRRFKAAIEATARKNRREQIAALRKQMYGSRGL